MPIIQKPLAIESNYFILIKIYMLFLKKWLNEEKDNKEKLSLAY